MSAEAHGAVDAAAHHAPTAGEYINHHLRHLQNFEAPQKIADFSYWNLDSLFWSTLLGLAAVFMLWRAASKATSGVPGRFQAAI